MANTYTKVLIQLVFAVKGRQSIISERCRERVEKYICGIISNNKSKPLAIYCNPDHCHVLFGLNPNFSISDMARDIKSNSSRWIKENNWADKNFAWQEGYGAFSYARSQLDDVVKYIINQPQHHRKQTFREEYLKLLQDFEIEYDDRYIFEFIE